MVTIPSQAQGYLKLLRQQTWTTHRRLPWLILKQEEPAKHYNDSMAAIQGVPSGQAHQKKKQIVVTGEMNPNSAIATTNNWRSTEPPKFDLEGYIQNYQGANFFFYSPNENLFYSRTISPNKE